MSKRILITGAAGFTGQHACRHFQLAGWQVIAVSRQPHRAELAADEIRSCDLTERQAVERLVRDTRPDYVLHLAGMNDVQASWAQPMDGMAINIVGTLHLLSAMIEAGAAAQPAAGRVSLAASTAPAPKPVKEPAIESTSEISDEPSDDPATQSANDRRYGRQQDPLTNRTPAILIVGSSLSFPLHEDPPRPSHPYALSKTIQALAARSWAHLFQIPVMVAEPTNLIGPGTSGGLCGLLAGYIARWKKGSTEEPFRISSLTEKRDYLDVRDAVDAYEKILLHGEPGALYRFGSGKVRSIGEVLDSFTESVGCSFPYMNLQRPPRDPDPQALSLEPMARLGWQPKISFNQSIRDILDDARHRLTQQHEEEEDA